MAEETKYPQYNYSNDTVDIQSVFRRTAELQTGNTTDVLVTMNGRIITNDKDPTQDSLTAQIIINCPHKGAGANELKYKALSSILSPISIPQSNTDIKEIVSAINYFLKEMIEEYNIQDSTTS